MDKLERLGCSPATAKRAIREFREVLDEPLEVDGSAGGYRYTADEATRRLELPGLLGEALSPLARRAAWVADEAWNPGQSGRYLDDGSYELRLPYGRADELIQDILWLGDDVEVVSPRGLRAEVAARLGRAAARYGRGSAERTRF